MINAPTIVRLLRFPTSIRLEKKGNQYFGPLRRSGPVVLSERHDPVECTFRLTDPGLSFATGGKTVHGVEAFNEGEQRDLLLPWALVAEGNIRPARIIMEIDVNYEGSAEKHTATVPLALTYGVRRRVVGAVMAGAAATAVALVAARRRSKKTVVAADDEDVEVSLFNIAPTARTPASSAATNVKGAKVTVADEEDVELAVYNVQRPRKAASSKKKASSSKKASASKKASTSKKASSSKKASKAASAQRGSSKARKAAPRRSSKR